MIQKRKVAIFDIDGTIFRSSLLIEIVEALLQEKLFPQKTRKIYAESYQNWLNRNNSYELYIKDVVKAFEENIYHVEQKDFIRIAKKVIPFHHKKVYRYTRDLISQLKKKNYFLLAISHSPKELVDAFCINYGFDKVYGRVYEVGKNGKFTGHTLYKELINDKAKILDRALEKEHLTLKGSVGVGDSHGDITFLEKVTRPICFNPNSTLYSHAKSKGWEIVVERKDVIYEIRNPNIEIRNKFK